MLIAQGSSGTSGEPQWGKGVGRGVTARLVALKIYNVLLQAAQQPCLWLWVFGVTERRKAL